MTAPVQRPPSNQDSGSGLTSKVGPLPVWGWLAITAAGAIGVLLWLQNRKSASSATQNASGAVTTVSPSTSDVANLQDQLATVTSQIRDLQGTPSQTQAGSSPYSFLPGGSYLFGLVNDDNPAGKGIYVGIPHFGWAWAPSPALLTPYINSKHPVQLGDLTKDQANAAFGPMKAWTEVPQS